MLLIQEKEEPYQSKECMTCMDDYDVYGVGIGMGSSMCNDCKETTRTTFKCPRCEAEHSFFGKSDPVYCKICKALLPDIIKLKISPTKRVSYHNRSGDS